MATEPIKTERTTNREAFPGAQALQGYTPFPRELRTKDHTEPGFAEERGPKRTAILVVHGMGSQKPYATLDLFARGLLGFYGARIGAPLPSQEILLRQHKANVNTHQQDWTQAFVRIRPYSHPADQIDVYEYYWAPVITGCVSALQSLRFLIFAGLSPFQYLRDNLIIIDRAHPQTHGRSKLGWFIFAFVRELIRMLFIFIPAIAVSLGLYWLIATPIATIAFNQGLKDMGTFFTTPLDGYMALRLVCLLIRGLLIGMCFIFLIQELMARRKGAAAEKSRRLYFVFILVFLAILILVPHWLQGHIRLKDRVQWFLGLPPSRQATLIAGAVIVLVALSLLSKVLRSAWRRAGAAINSHRATYGLAFLAILAACIAIYKVGLAQLWKTFAYWLSLPGFVNWKEVAFYTFLALFVFVAQRVLTTAIGCLAVYLGSDDLSKNFAARSQILHECTTMLIDLLSGRDETGNPDPDWNYDEVLVAAHSLGSVIAYDSMTELIIRNLAGDPAVTGLEKIKGLLTFGCPLNKVVYFFRTRITLRTNVLTKVLYMLHPFRVRTALPPGANPAIPVPHPFPQPLPFSPEFKWFNAYSPFDIISGRMVFYTADRDVAVEKGVAPWTAHLSYWENDDLYSLFSRLL